MSRIRPFRARWYVVTLLVFSAAVYRLLPHPPNFVPICALALFAGAAFADIRSALMIPLAAMLLSDAVLGFSIVTPFVYGCIALAAVMGRGLRVKATPLRVLGGSIGTSALFFVVTNFAVWALLDYYPKTAAGLGLCYIAAIPFFQNAVAADLLLSVTLFGGLRLAETRLAWMRELPPMAAH